MPSVSPSGPMRRTSFALISSLIRFSLSFALIVQHLQAKKIPYKDTRLRTATPLHTLYSLHKRKSINPHHNRCAGESGALCFVLPAYYTTTFLVCQHLFCIFSKYFRFVFQFLVRHKMSMENSHKKDYQNSRKILSRMLFHKFFCRFSSQLNIYKSGVFWYNVLC